MAVTAAFRTQKSHIGRCMGPANEAGLVPVRVSTRVWNRKVDKWFTAPFNITAHDYNRSVRDGDVVQVDLCHYRGHSSAVKKEIAAVLAPYQVPVCDRPAVLSQSDRLARWSADDETKFRLKMARREEDAVAKAKTARGMSEAGEGRGGVLDAVAVAERAARRERLVEELRVRFGEVERSIQSA